MCARDTSCCVYDDATPYSRFRNPSSLHSIHKDSPPNTKYLARLDERWINQNHPNKHHVYPPD